MRYDSTLTAIVLKKQPLGEADVLVTWYTKEQGKLRSVAAGARRLKSKLSFALLHATVVSVRLVGRDAGHGLFKLAGAVPIKTYIQDYIEEQALLLSWFLEILIRATPDAQSNPGLFLVAEDFFHRLSFVSGPKPATATAVYTLIHVLEALGVAVHEDGDAPQVFTAEGGGFFKAATNHDRQPVRFGIWQRYSELKEFDLHAGPALPASSYDLELLTLLESFIEYHLERQIRSYRFLGGIISEDRNV